MLTKEEILKEAEVIATRTFLCTNNDYYHILIKLLLEENEKHRFTIVQHKLEIEHLKQKLEEQQKEIQTLIKFMGKEQYIRFKNKGLNYGG